MDFSLDLGTVQTALSRVMDCSPPKSSFEGAVPLQVEALTNSVVLSVRGDTSVVLYTVPVTTVSSGTVVIDFNSCYSAVMALNKINEDGDGAEVVRFFKGSQTFKIITSSTYSGKKTRQTRSISILGSSFSSITTPDTASFNKVPFAPFVDAVRSVAFSVPVSTDKSLSGGVVFECSESGLKTASTNGVSLTEFVYPGIEVGSRYSANLSSDFVIKLGKLFYKMNTKKEECEDVSVLLEDNTFWVKYKSLLLAAPSQNTVFPDYSPLLEGKDKKFIISSKVFSDNVRNIMFSSSKDDDFRITLRFMEGSLSIVSSTCENEDIPIEAGEHNVQIDFNAYLIDGAVRSLLSNYFVLSYKDRRSPVLIEPYDSDRQMLLVVAPLK